MRNFSPLPCAFFVFFFVNLPRIKSDKCKSTPNGRALRTRQKPSFHPRHGASASQQFTQHYMLDIFILVVIVWALFSGWRNGLLKELVNGAGYLFGLLIAATCYSTFGEYLAVNGTESNMMTSIIAFFILWVVAPIVLGLVANLLTKVLNRAHLGGINRLAGAGVSCLKFTILLSCVLSVMSAIGILNEQRTKDSVLFEPVKEVLSSVIDIVIGDDARPMEQADHAAVAGDTLWVDVHKK